MGRQVRRFEVHKVPKKDRTPQTITRFTAGKGFETETVDSKIEQFDVYLPSGQSMRVHGETELERLGLTQGASLVDMETGEAVADPARVPSLREHVSRVRQIPQPRSQQVEA